MKDNHKTQKEIWSGYMRTLGQVLAIGPILWIWRGVTKMFKRPKPTPLLFKVPPPPPKLPSKLWTKESDDFMANITEIKKLLNQMRNE